MHFQLTEEQRALRDGTRDLLSGRFGREVLRAAVDADTPAVDRELWRELGEAGLFALCLPESEGGVGIGLPDAVVVFEEVGRALVPGPLVATFLAAGEVPGAAAGETVVTSPYGSLLPWRDDADVVRGDASRARPIASADPLTPCTRSPGPPPSPSKRPSCTPPNSSARPAGRSTWRFNTPGSVSSSDHRSARSRR